jgi:glutamate N-acetyltransferase / amino-acid N-acetyltransferase
MNPHPATHMANSSYVYPDPPAAPVVTAECLPAGFRYAAVAAGIKPSGTPDVTLIACDQPSTAAGVYTTNQVVAAPVVLSRGRTPTDRLWGVVINSGNANACTGTTGSRNAAAMTEIAAAALGRVCHNSAAAPVEPEQVLVMSTGIIGRPLPMDRIGLGIDQAAGQLGDSLQHFLQAADGILTTDQGRKVAAGQIEIDGRTLKLVGMAKGAGMIGPRMATMLGCLMTDAPLTAAQAQALLQRAADRSFNCVSVDGHTSTNDSLVLLASGRAGGARLDDSQLGRFAELLDSVCVDLAIQIPTDGEGASHLIEVRIAGAADDRAADTIARSIAMSNLVKTAVAGGDPNWGRIVSAAGYAGPAIDADALALKLNGIPLLDAGQPLEVDLASASEVLKRQHRTLIELTVGTGTGRAVHWTSDLNTRYVHINADYTT